MDFWIPLLSLAVLLGILPYLRWLGKRLWLYIQLKRICQKKNFVLTGTHLLWFWGRVGKEHCDFYIETTAEVYAVKLFAVLHRSSVLVFQSDGHYFIRRFIILISSVGSGIRSALNSKPKALIDYNFRLSYQNSWEIKTPRNLLLIHPTSYEIRRQPQRGGEIILGTGDFVNGMEIYTLSRLLGDLERTQ